jgi:AcrR family transcriptional regulator
MAGPRQARTAATPADRRPRTSASASKSAAVEEPADDAGHSEQRRLEIVRAASELFVAKGYAETSMGDVGNVVGMSGPALYHYFSGKKEILVCALLHADMRLQVALQEALRLPPDDALDELIRSYVDVTVEEPIFVAIWLRDRPQYEAALGPDLHREHQRAYIEEWIMTLGRVRPQISSLDARILVQAALGAVNSIALYRPGVEPDHLKDILATVANEVLHAPVQGGASGSSKPARRTTRRR